MSVILATIIIFAILILILINAAKNFLLSMGIEVNDFISFLKADQKLTELYKISRKYNSLSTKEKLIFLDDSKEIFNAFSKVPDRLWESQYNKYMDILDIYQNAKVENWKKGINDIPKNLSFKEMKANKKLKQLSIKGNSIKTKRIYE